jgi:hypothetical protein
MFGVWEWVKTNGNEPLRKLVNLIVYKGLVIFWYLQKTLDEVVCKFVVSQFSDQ